MRIDVGGGVRLFVDMDGPGLVPDGPRMRTRPTIVFLHGGPGMDHSSFTSTRLTELRDVAQLVFYDHRGQGRSDGTDPADWTLDRWADDVVALCDALGVTRPIVYGASFGGMVAQRYLARHPDHPAAVVLACTCARIDIDRIAEAFGRVGGPEPAVVARRFWGGDPDALLDYVTHCMPLYSVGPADPEAAGRVEMDLEVMAHFIGGEQQTMDLRAGLSRARCPVLVVGGERDPVCPIEANQEVADALPAGVGRFVRIPGASHLEVEGDASVDLVRELVLSLAADDDDAGSVVDVEPSPSPGPSGTEGAVVVSAGTLRPEPGRGVAMAHRWTEGGVVVEADFTGAHLYHLAAAGCVLNDLFREAEALGLALDGVRVRAAGGFDAGWASTGITYEVEIASEAADQEVERLLDRVDEVAEIPRALRRGAPVVRRPLG